MWSSHFSHWTRGSTHQHLVYFHCLQDTNFVFFSLQWDILLTLCPRSVTFDTCVVQTLTSFIASERLFQCLLGRTESDKLSWAGPACWLFGDFSRTGSLNQAPILCWGSWTSSLAIQSIKMKKFYMIAITNSFIRLDTRGSFFPTWSGYFLCHFSTHVRTSTDGLGADQVFIGCFSEEVGANVAYPAGYGREVIGL